MQCDWDVGGLELIYPDAALLLRVQFGPEFEGRSFVGQAARQVADMTLVSDLKENGDWNTAERQLTHRLIFEAVDMDHIRRICTSTTQLPRALASISMAVLQAKQICTVIENMDFGRIDDRIEISGHRLLIRLSSVKAFTRFWLSCNVHLPSVLYKPPHWEFHHESGQSWETGVPQLFVCH